jgi:acyl dehydratase
MPYSYEPHHFEDMEVGKTFESAGRTITETDFVVHSMFTGDWTELHTNREYAEEGPFGARIAQGPMTFIVATGLFQRTGVVERTVVAFLGMNYMNLPIALGIGETVSCQFECTKKRELESRDDAGLVVIDTTMTNQDDEVVFEGDMKFLFKKRSAEQESATRS